MDTAPRPVPGPTDTDPSAPTPPPRLLLLDVLRGLAIIGTLAMNIRFFDDSSGTGHSWIDTATGVFVNGSFLSLLALMFGAGLAVQYRSAQASGRPWPGRHPWRAVLLFLEGTLHVVLVFALDVLMGYAVTALLVIWLLGRSERVRSVVMWSALGLHLALMSALVVANALAGPSAGEIPDREQARYDATTLLFMEGPYLDQVAHRFTNFLGSRFEIIFAFPMTVFLFLLGVRLYRAGVFNDSATGRRIRARMAVWGLGLGIPLNVLATQFFVLGETGRFLFPMVLIFGYIGLVGWLLDHAHRTGQLTRSLRAVGRTALTCYILQNVLASAVFYGWGAGLAAYLEAEGVQGLVLDAWIYGAWFGISLLLVAGARLWLHRFERGPLEAFGARLVALVPERSARSSVTRRSFP